MGFMQRRVGPNISGPYGVLQPLVDGLKLLVHTFPLLRQVQWRSYMIAPLVSFFAALGGFICLPDPHAAGYNDGPYSLLLLTGFAAYGLFGTVLAG